MPTPASGRQQLVRPAQRLGPVLLRERPRRDLVAVGVALELVRLDRDRVVPVGADAVALAALAEVHRAVLVAQDRMLDLDRRPGQLRQRIGPGEEVLHRLHRDQRQAERAHELGRPEAEADERRRGADRALVGLDRRARDRRAMSMPVARVLPMNVAPRASARSCSAWQMLAPLAMPSLGTCSAPCRRSRSSSGMWRIASSGVITWLSRPHDVA